MEHLKANNDKKQQSNRDYLAVLLAGCTYNPEDYKMVGKKFQFTCSKGHQCEDSYSNIERRCRRDPTQVCKQCNCKEPNTLDNAYRLLTEHCDANKFTLRLTREEYTGGKQQITTVCPHGHENRCQAVQFRQRSQKRMCDTCHKLGSMTNDDLEAFHRRIVEFCKRNDLELLTTKITTKHDLYQWRCADGHLNEGKMNRLPTVVCAECGTRRVRNKQVRHDCGQHPYNKHLADCITRAKKLDDTHSRPFNITYIYIYDLWLKQDGVCHYTGERMVLEPGCWNSGSIDRLDNNRGHVEGNCVLTLDPVNKCKADMNHDQFIDWLDQVDACADVSTELSRRDLSGVRDRCKVARRDDVLDGREHDLPSEQAIALVRRYKNRCALSGIPLSWDLEKPNYASWDRLDNSKGHTLSNVQPVLAPLNKLKGVWDSGVARRIWNALLDNAKK
jgi:hypothetical protein